MASLIYRTETNKQNRKIMKKLA